jgi:hypothetical protein
MIKVIENGIVSEPELVDFIVAYKKMVDAGIMKETSFVAAIKKLGIVITKNGGYQFDKDSTYYLHFKR